MSDDPAEHLRWLESRAEEAYAQMYDATDATTAAARYSDAKEYLTDAIALARKRGDDEAAARLEARRAHIKAVFRSQLS